MGIKVTAPFDSLSIDEEYGFRQPRKREKFAVKVNGLHVEYFHQKVHAHQTSLHYGGREFQIQGEGFDRFISIN